MSGGVRPKGSKSYAATRSPEAAEAFRQDQAAQKTLDTADKKLCPKCGSEMWFIADVNTGKKAHWWCPYRRGTSKACGHEEKVE